jgi:epoxyqueuosine reductase
MGITRSGIKRLATNLGAEQCGIAAVDRFTAAPPGYRPTDIFPACRSVIVLLTSMPPDILSAPHPIPYTHTMLMIYAELDRIALAMTRRLGRDGVRAVPVPANSPYLFWDAETTRGQGILSMRHAAVAAGLGVLGKNTLLLNQAVGNLAYLGAVLTDAPLASDPLVPDLPCPPGCTLCLDACPQRALNGVTVNQLLCRKVSLGKTARGLDVYLCSKCRQVCPQRLGYGTGRRPARGRREE